MNTEDIKGNPWAHVVLNARGDLVMTHKRYVYGDKGLRIVKLTRGGLAYLQDEDGKFITVPPRNVEFAEETRQGNAQE